MTLETLLAQLSDPFRIGLLVALVFTMLRTRAQTGTWAPLAAGIVFVAVMIPMTTGAGNGWQPIASGLVANAIVVAVLMAIVTVYGRLRR